MRLRMDAAPEFSEDVEKWPYYVQVPSCHNTPIESFWLWLRKGEGHNLKDIILSGAAKHHFKSYDPDHQ